MRLPEHTLRRLAAHQQAQHLSIGAFSGVGADGAPLSPMNTRWMVLPRSPDADQNRGLPRQRAESRQLRATSPLAAGPIETVRNRVVGTGLQPVFAPVHDVLGWTPERAATWATSVANEFSLWADSRECTLDQSATFYEWQAHVLETRLTSGDCFTNLPDAAQASPTNPYRLRLQLLEADRCGNPQNAADTATISAGVRRGPGGAPEAYYIYNEHPGNVTTTTRFQGEWYTRVGSTGRHRILHHYRPTRPEQTRGVPYLAPVIQTIKDLGRFTEAEITAAVINSFYTTFITSKSTGNRPPPVAGAELPGTTSPGPEIALAPGAVIGLAEDESIEAADPKRPNPNAEGFINGMLALIGMGLGIPRELLIKSFNSSYSASRAALLDAWFHFRTERAWLVNSACQPALETWMAEAVATGRIVAPGFFNDPLMRWAYTRAAWHGDSQGSINVKDEVDAYRSAIDGRLMTHERAAWELFSSDWTRTFPVMRRENQALADANMLPVPRAGAAAQQTTKPTQAAQAEAQAETQAAIASLKQQIAALEARQPFQVNVQPAAVTVHTPDVHVENHLPAPSVTVQAPDITVTPPAVNVQAPNVTVQPAEVHLEATVQAAPAQIVIAQPQATRSVQTVAHNAAGEIASVTTTTEVVA